MKAKGNIKQLTDPRDIYEKVANDGARRLRACILGIIPGDIVDKAIEECERTLAGQNSKPLKERIASALGAFKEQHRVTQPMIEERFGYNAEAFTERDYLDLIKIFNSLRDSMSKVEDWFDKSASKKESSGLAEAFTETIKDEAPKPETKVEEAVTDDNEISFEQ